MTDAGGLQVIGAGFGRTGTLSLKKALEQLGYVPCHHMLEVYAHPEQAPVWQAAGEGKAVDWDRLLAGYRSAVDWPGAHFWRQLAAHYPAAKVILTLRDEAAWYRSIASTIMASHAAPSDSLSPETLSVRRMVRKVVFEGVFADRMGEPEHAIAVYRRHNAEVRAALPAARLLVFDVAEGWAPLCRFLGCREPEAPFPRTNTTEEFLDRRRKLT